MTENEKLEANRPQEEDGKENERLLEAIEGMPSLNLIMHKDALLADGFIYLDREESLMVVTAIKNVLKKRTGKLNKFIKDVSKDG